MSIMASGPAADHRSPGIRRFYMPSMSWALVKLISVTDFTLDGGNAFRGVGMA